MSKLQRNNGYYSTPIDDAFVNQDPWSDLEALPEFEEKIPFTYEELLNDITANLFGQEAISDIVYDIYTYLASTWDGPVTKHNFIIAGPSASGKTELYRVLKRILKKHHCPIPVLHLDLSGCSPAGYSGGDLSMVPSSILDANSDGCAIVFLDEFDKILTPLTSTAGDLHEALQHELLTMIEGRVCQVQKRNLTQNVDTTKTLFIGMGAFTNYRRERKEEKEYFFGFAPNTKKEPEEPKKEEYLLSMEDLLRVGGAVELIGRFDEVYNFVRFSRDVFDDLFEKIVTDLSIEQRVLIKVSEEAIEEFFTLARSEFGCREVKRLLYQTVKPCLKEIIDKPDEERMKFRIFVEGIKNAKLQKRV